VDGFSAAPRLAESIMSMAPHLTGKTAGYIPFFITTSLMGVPAILLILVVMRVRPGPRPAPLPAAA
ncbi:MAG: hypothetical protein K9G30_03085, partial [Parvibaculum sp.]|nr:hypothetical protein [Parvibaculum sp.]